MAEFTYTGENSRLRKSDLKTINGTSIVGSGDIVISGGGSGDTNVIETVKVNGTTLIPDANKAVDISIPTKTSELTNDSNFTTLSEVTLTIVNSAPATLDTLNELAAALGNDANFATTVATQIGEKYTKPSTGIPASDLAAGVIPTVPVQSVNGQTGTVTLSIPDAVTESIVSGWGFTKNTGTYSKPSGGIPKSDLASAVQTSLDKADTALQSFTETDPTVPAWAKTANKPTYTAAEVGALPDTTVIPAAPGTLNTTATTAQSTSSSEALSGNITLHKIAKTGNYNDLLNKPTISINGNGSINVSGLNLIGPYYNLGDGVALLTNSANYTTGEPGTRITTILDSKDATSLLYGGDEALATLAAIKTLLPTVNNATLTIQKNGTTVNTFTANASSNVTANIQVNELPTVSSSDNGKILQVVNGAWALVTPTSIYSGTSAPNNSTGNDGDLYLQTS